MHLVVNGTDLADLEDGCTVDDVLARLSLGAKWVLVEHNGQPVDRACFPQHRLGDGDRLEIVRAVAGG